jgi:hypothetical protein
MSMNTKLLAPALGALLLGGSTLALADNWDSHHRGGPQFHAPHHDVSPRGGRHWDSYRDHRWSPPAPRVYWQPAPVWYPRVPVYGGRGYSGNGPYNRDGVTIILRGRIN